MSTVGMHEAKTRLSELVHEIEAGGEVTITRHGTPVARLVAIVVPRPASGFGAMRGRGRVADLDWAEVTAGDHDIAEMFADRVD
jgi:prevent-host-death family protein